jgi:hypothetical protein
MVCGVAPPGVLIDVKNVIEVAPTDGDVHCDRHTGEVRHPATGAEKVGRIYEFRLRRRAPQRRGSVNRLGRRVARRFSGSDAAALCDDAD